MSKKIDPVQYTFFSAVYEIPFKLMSSYIGMTQHFFNDWKNAKMI